MISEDSLDTEDLCRESCLENIYCTAYQFKSQTKECKICKDGQMKNEGNDDIISGICPTVKADLQHEFKEDIQNKIGGNNWWCANATEDGKMCNFPFTINGLKHYKPVGRTCISVDNTKITEFTKDELVSCSPCPGNDPIDGVGYSGYPLFRITKNETEEAVYRNDYSCVTLTECQYLCYITEACLYFNLDFKASGCTQPLQGSCWLKYGMENWRKSLLLHLVIKITKLNVVQNRDGLIGVPALKTVAVEQK